MKILNLTIQGFIALCLVLTTLHILMIHDNVSAIVRVCEIPAVPQVQLPPDEKTI